MGTVTVLTCKCYDVNVLMPCIEAYFCVLENTGGIAECSYNNGTYNRM